MPAMLTKAEAAAFLRVDIRTISRMIARGDLAAARLGARRGCAVRISKVEILRIAGGRCG